MRLRPRSHRQTIVVFALTMLAACAGTNDASDTIPDDVEHPWHPTCREACEGHCEAPPDTCSERCERECAPANDATQPSG